MDGGTLIGLLLNHSPMPWNDDIDTLIDIENKDKAIRLLLRTGGHIMKSFYDGWYSKLWDTSAPHVDSGSVHNWSFVMVWKNLTHTWEKHIKGKQKKYAGHMYPQNMVYPVTLRPYGYGNLVASVPHDGKK
tara:strand:+ start:250 stop:642 length:393 start_codon:yes stop_codon:yes gene_type:complete